jgi:SAM-dependent methyltransferase
MNFPARPCPVCLSDRKQVLYGQKFFPLSGQLQLRGYDVAECGKCGAAYAENIPDQKWFDAYYREVSKYTHDQRAGEESVSDSERFRDIANFISKHLPGKQSRIFDMGCASGGLLRRLKDLGYTELLGMEKSPSSAELARRRHGIRVANSDLAEMARDEEPFDLLIQVGVLEHIRDVEGAFTSMSSVLRPGGLIYLEVPDVAGFAEWPGAPFQQFSIEHINFFSHSSLIALMARKGFDAVEVIRTARDHTSNTKMPVVCGFFRQTDVATKGEPKVDLETGPALRRYIEESTQAEGRIAQVIDALVSSQEPILVWGVGTHTLHLIETTDFGRMNVVAFIDSNPGYQERELQGKRVIAPSALNGCSQRILISSQVFQAEIEDQIKLQLRLPNEVILLYKPVTSHS